MTPRRAGALAAAAAAVFLAGTAHAGPWKKIAPGMEVGRFQAKRPASHGDAGITVVRIDPGRWELEVVGISRTGEKTGRTAREWSQEHGFAAAINAGMFATDYKTHVGYMRSRGHVNSSHVHGKYHSVAAFHPMKAGLPPFHIFDLDQPGVTLDGIKADYGSVVQNLRLIKRPGENRWPAQDKRWSEAALGEDTEGRILFILCRSPFSMRDLNEELLGLEIGLVAAQHLEGGPEAQLFVAVEGYELEVFGSYETAFKENDENTAAWRVPNIFGVRPKRGDPAGGQPEERR